MMHSNQLNTLIFLFKIWSIYNSWWIKTTCICQRTTIIFVNEIAVGFISYLTSNPGHGTIEIGNINFGEKLLRIRPATEAIFLMLQCAFDILGHQRVEWKCNALKINHDE